VITGRNTGVSTGMLSAFSAVMTPRLVPCIVGLVWAVALRLCRCASQKKKGNTADWTRTYITPTDPVYLVSSLPPKSDTLLPFCLTILVFSLSRVGSNTSQATIVPDIDDHSGSFFPSVGYLARDVSQPTPEVTEE
jgi:hypothetical protein